MILKGLTWDHPRGWAPLNAGRAEYQKLHPGVSIQWDRRTLREFGEAPIEQYLGNYDLVIIDHPFVGFAAQNDVLVNFASILSDTERNKFAADSVGPSWQSYWYGGGLWALPIDAATQVACYRPDLLSALSSSVPRTWEEVLQLARTAREAGKWVVVPACPTDAISLFFTLNAGLKNPIPEDTAQFAEPNISRQVLSRLHQLIALAHPSSVDWNPIEVYDYMVEGSDAVYSPYGFGYSNYSRAGSEPLLKFADAPAVGTLGCAGTMSGGTGVAVSRQSANQEAAVAYARWLTTPEHQAGTYFAEGGQPASLFAWTNKELNRQTHNFFQATLKTLETAYVRPRFSGFVQFFEAAGIAINRCLRQQLNDDALIEFLNATYHQAWKKARSPE